MRRLFISASTAAIVAVACAAPQKAPTVDAPVARERDRVAAPNSAPAPDVTAWVKDWPKSWTDPRVVNALAARCDFVPVNPSRYVPPDSTPSDLFACKVGFEQACVPDPCWAHELSCTEGCEKTCRDCGTTCAGDCTTCKSSCKDDACRMQCASKCAECKQTCNRTLDRCSSGDCGKAHEACADRLRAAWKKNGCTAKCAGFSRCQTACTKLKEAEFDPCIERCETKASPTFNACRDACFAQPDTGDQNAQGICFVKCIETSGCSAFMCQTGDYGQR